MRRRHQLHVDRDVRARPPPRVAGDAPAEGGPVRSQVKRLYPRALDHRLAPTSARVRRGHYAGGMVGVHEAHDLLHGLRRQDVAVHVILLAQRAAVLPTHRPGHGIGALEADEREALGRALHRASLAGVRATQRENTVADGQNAGVVLAVHGFGRASARLTCRSSARPSGRGQTRALSASSSTIRGWTITGSVLDE